MSAQTAPLKYEMSGVRVTISTLTNAHYTAELLPSTLPGFLHCYAGGERFYLNSSVVEMIVPADQSITLSL